MFIQMTLEDLFGLDSSRVLVQPHGRDQRLWQRDSAGSGCGVYQGVYGDNMSEKNIQSLVMLAISQQPGTCIFLNSIGRGVVGKIVKQGDVFIVHHGRVVDFGVANPGGPDLIGWKTEIIDFTGSGQL